MSKPTPVDRRDDSWQAAQQGRRRRIIALMGTEGTSVSLPPTGDPTKPPMQKEIELQDKWKYTKGASPSSLPQTKEEEAQTVLFGSAMAASFGPQRHQMMVCGRPVVATLVAGQVTRTWKVQTMPGLLSSTTGASAMCLPMMIVLGFCNRTARHSCYHFIVMSLPPSLCSESANLPLVISWLFLSPDSSKALVLMHELTKVEEMSDYFPRVLHPMVPMAVMGRSWAAAPSCSADKAVWSGWKDSRTKGSELCIVAHCSRVTQESRPCSGRSYRRHV